MSNDRFLLVLTGVLVSALSLAPSTPSAATWTVTPGGPLTIQAAIDAAAPGDSVVLAGTAATPFTGDGNRDLSLHGKAITVTGAGYDAWIDCQGSSAAAHGGFGLTDGEGPGT